MKDQPSFQPGERCFIVKPRQRLPYDRVAVILSAGRNGSYFRVQPFDCANPQTLHVKYLKRQP